MKTMYYVALNDIDKQIYLGKCSEHSLFEQNLRSSLKIKGDELSKWEIYSTDYEINGDEIEYGSKSDVYLNFFKEFKLRNNKESFKIINKQPKVLYDFINCLRYELNPEQKLLLTIFKELI